MKYIIIIPAHNEELHIGKTLHSIAEQTVLPSQVVVCDDHSSDQTHSIARDFSKMHPWIKVVKHQSEAQHQPGSKVIRAFMAGLKSIDMDYDFIVKLDADLILPPYYFETLLNHFNTNPKLGLAGGFAYIQIKDQWILENLTDKHHVRGAFKMYRKSCFEQIGGLQPVMGWDTLDELLCHYYNWEVLTDISLIVKHLKPTGALYNSKAAQEQGAAFYRLGYGWVLSTIASAKLSYRKKKIHLFLKYLKGYYKEWIRKSQKSVTPEQERYIQNYRWRKIIEKIGI